MNRLKELRKKKGISQKEFSKEHNIPLRTLQSWENGESQFKADRGQQLAEYFDVSLNYLLGFEDEPHKSMYDLAQQNPEDFPSDEDDLQDITPQGLVDASSENNKRYFYIENITNFVKDKKTTNSKLKLLSDLIDNFKKS
ncbi:helix-turn-helix domain-containing protein [Streptococcus parasanguinis]|jgi:XRE family transcriptional regulator|uniref:helix-turn-helix domain-containing protein n=1 Tax=Streptococcus parasanguinis TaxID=1318 RepID=UPI0012B0FBEF|nr:helix-turn-helix transcriptional regulator [Streptococcus parasanguinis]MSH49943.1 helix-turn-helix domain-containing protein [Escherichia coli]MTS09708.1 helix-turn-helix domain-containing protein [Streptococcus parasanguinis]